MRAKRATVDVVIPTYNGMPWLKRSLESVLSQTYKELKVYVIDDGSTDDTARYVRSVKDSRVIYLKKTNGGVSSARNLGIGESSSEFISFLDSDDIWLPNKIERQMNIMLSQPQLGLVYGHHYIIDDKDTVLGNLRLYKKGMIFDDLCDGNCIAGSASMVLIRRKAIEDVGIFNETLVNGEDWEYWLRIAHKYSIDFVPEIIASIRSHANNTQGNTKRMADGLVTTLQVILSEFPLTKNQKVRIASYCLTNAINMYLSINDYRSARHTSRHLVAINPHSLIDMSTWKIHVTFSLLVRGIFANKTTLLLAMYTKILLHLPFRVTRKIFRLIRRR